MVEKIHIIIPLIAAIVVEIFGICQKDSTTNIYGRLILTIVVFYILGCITRKILKTILDYNLYDGLEIQDTNSTDETEENKQEVTAAEPKTE